LATLITALPGPGSAAPTPSGSIRIDSEADLASMDAENSWPGDGSITNPYVIANLSINNPAKGVGIFIGNTTSYVRIENCIISNVAYLSDPYGPGAGIELYQASNVEVRGNTISTAKLGVYMSASSNNTFHNNTISGTSGNDAVFLQFGSNNLIDANIITNSQWHAVALDNTTSNIISNNTLTSPTYCGLGLWYSDGNVLYNNSIVNAGAHGIYAIRSEGGMVSNNTIQNAQWSGMYLDTSGYCTINNNTVRDALGTGIYLSTSGYSTMSGNNVTNVHSYGMYTYSSGNSNISNNTITNSRSTSIYLWSSAVTTIANNSVEGGLSTSIYLYLSGNSNITNNTINKTAGTGIGVGSCGAYMDGNELTNCTIYISPYMSGSGVQGYIDAMSITSSNTINGKPVYFLKNTDMGNATVPSGRGEVILLNTTRVVVDDQEMNAGVVIGFSSYITVTNIVITDATDGVILFASNHCNVYNNFLTNSSWENIYLESSSNNTISNNIITDGVEGITAEDSENNTIVNNIITNMEDTGIELYSADWNVVHNNTVAGVGWVGIYADYSNRNVISGNTVLNSDDYGIYADYSDNNTMSSNIVTASETYGLYFYGSSDNAIVGNSVSGSGSYGVNLTQSSGNTIYGNILVDNNGAGPERAAGHIQAYDDGANLWNDTVFGNYWSDWQSPQIEHGGIIDLPYEIDGVTRMQDELPVTMNITITSPSSPVYTNLSTILVSGTTLDLFLHDVTWLNEATGASGICSGTDSWSANIALVEGNNHIIVTMTDSSGNHTSAEMTVICDIVAPVVTAYTPTSDAIAVDVPIAVTFSEPMNTASVSVSINGVSGTLSWNGNVATFTPSLALAYGTTYSVIVSGQDLAGNAVSYEWSFNTSNVGSISGTIEDASGNAIANATVTLSNGMTTTTDVNGHFVFDNVTAGTYDLTIAKDGYATITKSVSTSAGVINDAGILSVQATTSNSSSNDLVIIGALFLVIVALLAAALVLFRRRKK
jgi:parallel beta-helix repeat protein